jgi:hypothetical protein
MDVLWPKNDLFSLIHFQGKLVTSMSREELDLATGPEDAVKVSFKVF